MYLTTGPELYKITRENKQKSQQMTTSIGKDIKKWES